MRVRSQTRFHCGGVKLRTIHVHAFALSRLSDGTQVLEPPRHLKGKSESLGSKNTVLVIHLRSAASYRVVASSFTSQLQSTCNCRSACGRLGVSAEHAPSSSTAAGSPRRKSVRPDSSEKISQESGLRADAPQVKPERPANMSARSSSTSFINIGKGLGPRLFNFHCSVLGACILVKNLPAAVPLAPCRAATWPNFSEFWTKARFRSVGAPRLRNGISERSRPCKLAFSVWRQLSGRSSSWLVEVAIYMSS